MPDTGCHSVIERPDSVSLVTPPSTTMTKIIAAQARSQAAMLRSARVAAAALGAMREVRMDKAARLRFQRREAEGRKLRAGRRLGKRRSDAGARRGGQGFLHGFR